MKPTRFGGYELLEKIGVGGMAEVFRARARRPGGVTKIVCLKRIHARLCTIPDFIEMFIEEARLSMTLSHGNIVPSFDFGCVDGRYYLVMDFVEGYDLGDVVGQAQIVSKPFLVELAIFVVMEVLEGLAYAHGRRDEAGLLIDLVHRDINPANVMISTAGEVKILDFGIAKSRVREFRTSTGIVKGSPGYMAPEQARAGKVDARTDLYACGVLLYELVTGERPPDAMAFGVAQGLVRHGDERVAMILDRALSPRPEDRYQSALDMRNDLAAYLVDEAIQPSSRDLALYVASLFKGSAASPDWAHSESGEYLLLVDAILPRSEPLPETPSKEALVEDATEEITSPHDDEERVEDEPDVTEELTSPEEDIPTVEIERPEPPQPTDEPYEDETAPEHPLEESAPTTGLTVVTVAQALKRPSSRSLLIAIGVALSVTVCIGILLESLDTQGTVELVDTSVPPQAATAAGQAREPEGEADATAVRVPDTENQIQETSGDRPVFEEPPRSAPWKRRDRPHQSKAAADGQAEDGGLGTLTRQEVREGLQGLGPYFRICLKRASPPLSALKVRINIDGAGKATYLGASPQPPSTVSWCLEKVLRQASFRSTGAGSISVVYPVNVPGTM